MNITYTNLDDPNVTVEKGYVRVFLIPLSLFIIIIYVVSVLNLFSMFYVTAPAI